MATPDLSYLTNLEYDPKFVIIDDFSLEELNKKDEMRHILNSDYVEFVEGKFEGRSESLFRKYGTFDFVWFDCGGVTEYQTFFRSIGKYVLVMLYVILHSPTVSLMICTKRLLTVALRSISNRHN